jgi:DNA-directed RNA polymerase specialized sigma24 family protein
VTAGGVGTLELAVQPWARDFEDAVDVEGPRLHALAVSIIGDPGEAEDVLQETMVQAWRAWDTIHDPRRRGAWLATICVRTALRARRRLRLGSRHAGLAADLPAPGTPLSRLDIVEACRLLSPRQRAVIVLHYVHGYSLDECGPILGCRPGTVRPHLRRALRKLRQVYVDD